MSTDPRDQIIAHLIAQHESQRSDLRAMRAVYDDMKEELVKRKAELAKMNDELKDMHVEKNTICAEIQQERALKETLERENRLLEEELALSKEASSNFKRSKSGKSKAAGASGKKTASNRRKNAD